MNESLDQTATLELTAPVTSHENGHSGLYLKGGTKATVSGGSFTENGAEHAEIYAEAEQTRHSGTASK